MAMRGSEPPKETREDEEEGSVAISCSSLASLLLCTEAAPSIMEHEKAILVAKEHDYARRPSDYGLMQLTPLILQQMDDGSALAADDVMENCRASRNGQSSETRRQVKSLCKKDLLACQQMLLSARRDLLRESDEGVPGHLREMVVLQASLINTLQEQLHVREVELTSVRREKEQVRHSRVLQYYIMYTLK